MPNPNSAKTSNENLSLKKEKANPYSRKYRILKTVLLVLAWVSYGIIQEMPRTTLEDLRILLNTNYSDTSLFMIAKNIGYLLSTILVGILLDKFLTRADTIIAFGKLFMVSSKSKSGNRLI